MAIVHARNTPAAGYWSSVTLHAGERLFVDWVRGGVIGDLWGARTPYHIPWMRIVPARDASVRIARSHAIDATQAADDPSFVVMPDALAEAAEFRISTPEVVRRIEAVGADVTVEMQALWPIAFSIPVASLDDRIVRYGDGLPVEWGDGAHIRWRTNA